MGVAAFTINSKDPYRIFVSYFCVFLSFWPYTLTYQGRNVSTRTQNGDSTELKVDWHSVPLGLHSSESADKKEILWWQR